MRGLTVGETSTDTNPVLQLYTRSGEFLADPVEATYQIDDIRDPSAAPISQVSPTALDLTAAPVGQKLGTGRFYLPSTDTSGWSTGTHRAVVQYRMVAGGRLYTQIILFEVLDAGDFFTGSSYVGYVPTRRLYQDGLYSLAGTLPERLHLSINQASLQLEAWTQRFFEPRYMQQRIDGTQQSRLFLRHAIIALDKLEQLDRNTDGFDATSTIDAGDYKVYNRHLDGLLNPDDRDNPILAIAQDIGMLDKTSYVTAGAFPSGRGNLLVSGVFGYTDPEPQSGRVLIGNTPLELSRIITALVERATTDPSMSSLATQNPGSVKSYKTRDQAIAFFGDASSSTSYGGWTGDPMLDQAILRFAKPARAEYDDRDAFDTGRI